MDKQLETQINKIRNEYFEAVVRELRAKRRGDDLGMMYAIGRMQGLREALEIIGDTTTQIEAVVADATRYVELTDEAEERLKELLTSPPQSEQSPKKTTRKRAVRRKVEE